MPTPDEVRARIAGELERLRDGARDTATPARTVEDVLPSPRPTTPPEPVETRPEPGRPEAPSPQRPDNAAVNELWSLPLGPAPRGRLFGVLSRFLSPLFDAQRIFNARQVQLDNEVLEYVEARFDATHRHYDRVLGDMGQHARDVDERHRLLQQDLIAHVHDLVKRIDLVLAESERGRAGLASALKDVRARLARLEEHLQRG